MQLGLAEALQILIGCDHTEEKGMELAKKIEQLYKTKCSQFKEQYKLNFGVYYSPAENLCHTAMKKFQEKYGKIPNVSDREYFTNSMHVPVWKKITVFDKIDIESQLTGYSSAGCITYVELDAGVKNNLSALEIIVNYAMDHDAIMAKYGSRMKMQGRVPEALSGAMADVLYMANFETKEQMDEYYRDLLA